MIELNDVCYAYENEPVLKHINLRVQKGEAVALYGENGAGKSTLL